MAITPTLDLLNASAGTGEAVRSNVTVIRTAGSTTITVDSLTNWPTKFIATIGRLVGGVLTTHFVFAGHKSGSTIIIDAIASGYTDVINSAVGDIVVLKPTTAWADVIASFLAVSLSNTGSLSAAALAQVLTSLSGQQVRLKPRLTTTASTATLTPNIDTNNIYELSAQAAALNIANPTGTPNDGDVLLIRLKDNGTARAITYGTIYQNVSGLSDLTTTVVSKWHYIGIQYNASATKWQIISITTSA